MRPRLQHRRSFEALWGEGRTFLHPKTYVMHPEERRRRGKHLRFAVPFGLVRRHLPVNVGPLRHGQGQNV